MGRPKIKMIDDSQPTEETKKISEGDKKEAKITRSFGKKGGDSLVESLKAELGIKEEVKKAPEVVTEEPKVKTEKTAKTSKKSVQKAKPRGKKYQESIKLLNTELKGEDADENYTYKSQSYKLNEALDMVRKLSFTKFDGTLEAHINTTVTGIRGLISLPFVTGKKITVVAFGKDADKSGADIVGDDSLLEEISKGKINFDIIVTTPDWMPKLAKVAKILGPKGLMPNPKSGTITTDLAKAVEGFKEGKTEYKTEAKGKVIHLALGKLNQPNEELSANIKLLLQALGKSRISKVTLTPTMGAAVKVDLASI